MATVILAVPAYSNIEPETAVAITMASQEHRVGVQASKTSILTANHNALWCMALEFQPRADYYVMLHSDVAPVGDWWIDRMIAEKQRLGVDLLSCVVPIKDDSERVSMCFFDPLNNSMRQLTLNDLDDLPETFTATDWHEPNQLMALNTGCMICDLKAPWVEKVWHQTTDSIVCQDGKWKPMNMPEDWAFTLMVQAHGGTVAATRKIVTRHYGRGEWRSDARASTKQGTVSTNGHDHTTRQPRQLQDAVRHCAHEHALGRADRPADYAGVGTH